MDTIQTIVEVLRYLYQIVMTLTYEGRVRLIKTPRKDRKTHKDVERLYESWGSSSDDDYLTKVYREIVRAAFPGYNLKVNVRRKDWAAILQITERGQKFHSVVPILRLDGPSSGNRTVIWKRDGREYRQPFRIIFPEEGGAIRALSPWRYLVEILRKRGEKEREERNYNRDISCAGVATNCLLDQDRWEGRESHAPVVEADDHQGALLLRQDERDVEFADLKRLINLKTPLTLFGDEGKQESTTQLIFNQFTFAGSAEDATYLVDRDWAESYLGKKMKYASQRFRKTSLNAGCLDEPLKTPGQILVLNLQGSDAVMEIDGRPTCLTNKEDQVILGVSQSKRQQLEQGYEVVKFITTDPSMTAAKIKEQFQDRKWVQTYTGDEFHAPTTWDTGEVEVIDLGFKLFALEKARLFKVKFTMDWTVEQRLAKMVGVSKGCTRVISLEQFEELTGVKPDSNLVACINEENLAGSRKLASYFAGTDDPDELQQWVQDKTVETKHGPGLLFDHELIFANTVHDHPYRSRISLNLSDFWKIPRPILRAVMEWGEHLFRPWSYLPPDADEYEDDGHPELVKMPELNLRPILRVLNNFAPSGKLLVDKQGILDHVDRHDDIENAREAVVDSRFIGQYTPDDLPNLRFLSWFGKLFKGRPCVFREARLGSTIRDEGPVVEVPDPHLDGEYVLALRFPFGQTDSPGYVIKARYEPSITNGTAVLPQAVPNGGDVDGDDVWLVPIDDQDLEALEGLEEYTYQKVVGDSDELEKVIPEGIEPHNPHFAIGSTRSYLMKNSVGTCTIAGVIKVLQKVQEEDYQNPLEMFSQTIQLMTKLIDKPFKASKGADSIEDLTGVAAEMERTKRSNRKVSSAFARQVRSKAKSLAKRVIRVETTRKKLVQESDEEKFGSLKDRLDQLQD